MGLPCADSRQPGWPDLIGSSLAGVAVRLVVGLDSATPSYQPAALTKGSAPCAAAVAEPEPTALGRWQRQHCGVQAGGPTVKPTGMRCSRVRARCR